MKADFRLATTLQNWLSLAIGGQRRHDPAVTQGRTAKTRLPSHERPQGCQATFGTPGASIAPYGRPAAGSGAAEPGAGAGDQGKLTGRPSATAGAAPGDPTSPPPGLPPLPGGAYDEGWPRTRAAAPGHEPAGGLPSGVAGGGRAGLPRAGPICARFGVPEARGHRRDPHVRRRSAPVRTPGRPGSRGPRGIPRGHAGCWRVPSVAAGHDGVNHPAAALPAGQAGGSRAGFSAGSPATPATTAAPCRPPAAQILAWPGCAAAGATGRRRPGGHAPHRDRPAWAWLPTAVPTWPSAGQAVLAAAPYTPDWRGCAMQRRPGIRRRLFAAGRRLGQVRGAAPQLAIRTPARTPPRTPGPRMTTDTPGPPARRDRQLRLRPGAPAHFDDAIAALRAVWKTSWARENAVAAGPDAAARGQFEEGWRLFETRPSAWAGGRAANRPRHARVGRPAGPSLLILQEQGLGDQIMFARYAAFRDQGVGPRSSPSLLARLFQRLGPASR